MPGTKYEYGNHYADRSTGDRLAKVRNEELECRRLKMSGESNILHLECGYVFSQINHFAGSLNQDYLVHEVKHAASQPNVHGVVETGESTGVYTNEFMCIPASAPFRPERLTSVPKVSGITTGKIETGGGDYAYLDDEGRYRAKMHFDQSSETDGAATLPIRMSQPHSGPDYGIHFPLHVGAEVVIAHVDGNADRPVVIGTVPNPNNSSPSTSANKPQNVIRTWANNELTFDDSKGEENIYMHATKDHTVAIENDETISIGHDQSQSIENDQSQEIGNDQTESVGNDQKLNVGNDRSKEVGNDQSAKIGNDKTISVGNDHTESIGANMEIKIEKDLTEEVGKNYSETVGDDMEVDVGKSMTIKVGKDKTDEVGKKYSESVGTDSSTEIGGAKTEKVGKKSSLEVEANYSVKAKKVSIVAADQIQLKTGKASITLLKSGDILIRGKKIMIKGSGDVILKGKKIQQN
jgi:type VI secretion system secreted protein VgrG